MGVEAKVKLVLEYFKDEGRASPVSGESQDMVLSMASRRNLDLLTHWF